VRGVNWLGDAVLSTPALLRLRERFPAARIALLTPEKLADLWLHHPAVDAVFSFRPDEQPWHIARPLRREHFDLGLIFPNSPRSALELWWARVPVRIGYRRPWRTWFLTHAISRRPDEVKMRKRKAAEVTRLTRAPAAAPATSRVFAGPPTPAHQLQLYLHLVGAVGASTEPIAPALRLSDTERASAPETIQRLAGPLPAADRPWLALNAGAEYGPAKRWPRERFVEAARQVGRRTGGRWLVLGGPKDVELAHEICAQVPEALPLAGRTNLRELMQVLSGCRVLLTNDSGPAHVAAALGVPVVALFGSTSPELTAPGLPGDPRHRILQAIVPCTPCFRRECPIDLRCMEGIRVEAVVDAVLGLLAHGEGP
jgi:heptosyltransferase-2